MARNQLTTRPEAGRPLTIRFLCRPAVVERIGYNMGIETRLGLFWTGITSRSLSRIAIVFMRDMHFESLTMPTAAVHRFPPQPRSHIV
ncbi:hypothetical protein AUP68_16103 [Ilyonectria robusta]